MRKEPRGCDYTLYKERNLIEHFFNQIKHFRAIAPPPRYAKRTRNFKAFSYIGTTLVWIASLSTEPNAPARHDCTQARV